MNRAIDQYFTEQRPNHLEQFKRFLRIPSVSTLSEYRGDVRRAAEYVAEQMQTLGLEHVELIETAGNPVVYGDWLHAPGKPTVLVYAHYDVQPAEPLELWETPPFEADIRDGMIYARGASDDKGHVFMHLKVCEALFAINGTLPINLKFCIEGEEEVGSHGLTTLLSEQKERFASDVVVVSDNAILGQNQPSICYALRGLAQCEIHVQGATTDLHSGGYGGAVQNAVHALVELLHSMHDQSGRITIAGFYDHVVTLSTQEREAISRLPYDEEDTRKRLGVSELYGEEGYSFLERTWIRPTLEVNGIYGGHIEEGIKTIVPSSAHAKISCRLVPNQHPDEVLALIEEHIKHHTPKGVTASMTHKNGANPHVVPIEHPTIKLAQEAYEQAYQAPVYFSRMGGSIPIVETFARVLEKPVVLLGFALPTGNAHAPNEHFSLDSFDRGLRALSYYWLGLDQALQAAE